jgi:hypothetical protein
MLCFATCFGLRNGCKWIAYALAARIARLPDEGLRILTVNQIGFYVIRLSIESGDSNESVCCVVTAVLVLWQDTFQNETGSSVNVPVMLTDRTRILIVCSLLAFHSVSTKDQGAGMLIEGINLCKMDCHFVFWW